jgi:hypothetical protein
LKLKVLSDFIVISNQGNCTSPPGLSEISGNSVITYGWIIDPNLAVSTTAGNVFPLGLAGTVLVFDAAFAPGAGGRYRISLVCTASNGATAAAAMDVQVWLWR